MFRYLYDAHHVYTVIHTVCIQLCTWCIYSHDIVCMQPCTPDVYSDAHGVYTVMTWFVYSHDMLCIQSCTPYVYSDVYSDAHCVYTVLFEGWKRKMELESQRAMKHTCA